MLSELSNTFFPLCSFVVSLFLMIMFFSKRNTKNIETNIYSKLIICGFFESLTYTSLTFAVDFFYSSKVGFWFELINKTLIMIYMIWISLILYYVIAIVNPKKAMSKKTRYYLIGVALFFIIAEFISPLDLYYDPIKHISNTEGRAIDILGVVCILYIINMFFILIKNRKQEDLTKKSLPLYFLNFSFIISLLIRFIDPFFNITSNIFSFVLLIMYHTIENPDIKMLEEVNFAKLQAEKANHAKTEFLSSMSHEIRTPLNAVVGFSQVLLDEDIPDNLKDEVNDIISASNTLLDIVNGILDISKIEANKIEIINKEYSFKQVFDELVTLTKVKIGEKSLNFKYYYDDSIPPVMYGDHLRVKQVILNLLTNSVKYTKEGFVEFKVNSFKKDDVCRIIISVEDSGVGIKQENIDKLFQKFERFEERNTTIEGTGLGLAITKSLVELMGGKIIVQSKYGKGSRFTIVLDQKIINKDKLENVQQNVKIENVDLSNKRVLLVDDNNLNIKVATRLLTNYKLQIDSCTSGFECLDKINNHEKYDLVFLDDMMPKMSGVETLQRLKQIDWYDIPTIALTANAIAGMKDKYLADGFDDYLSKPIDKTELNRVIDEFLNK